jgi:hypothetical protein
MRLSSLFKNFSKVHAGDNHLFDFSVILVYDRKKLIIIAIGNAYMPQVRTESTKYQIQWRLG